jgi:Flp pilus assembly protein CpaB
VDVLTTIESDGAHPTETVTLAEGVRVLAVSETLARTPTGELVARPQVTVAVSPQQAERLAVGANGPESLKLTLRAEVDFTVADPAPVRTADLFATERLTVREFRERFTEDEVLDMYDRVEALTNPPRSPIIDLEQIRDPTL